MQAVSFDADQALISLRQGYRLLVSNLHQSVTQDDITVSSIFYVHIFTVDFLSLNYFIQHGNSLLD